MFLTIDEAAQRLLNGGIVAIPTETVYGLAADASQPKAIERIFTVKGRPSNHPLIVHIGSIEQITDWACDIPDELWTLAKQFWPGPLTVVLKKQPHVSDSITGGQNTVALRIPNHEKALELLHSLKRGLCAPSANIFGRVSPSKAQHVIDELGSTIDGVIDGGECAVGIESTIVDLSRSDFIEGKKHTQATLLRPGQISQLAIEKCLGMKLLTSSKDSPKAPGMLKAHYAPTTPLLLLSEETIEHKLNECLANGLTINLWSPKPLSRNEGFFWQSMPNSADALAQQLYHQLRMFDVNSADITLIQQPPNNAQWHGVIDRLTRAAAHFPTNNS